MPVESHSLPKMKNFKFRVEFNGLPSFLVEEFDPGERTIGVAKSAGGGQNHVSKEGGFLEYGNATLRMVVPVEGQSLRFWDNWMDEIQDPKTGNGKFPSQYRRNFSLYEAGPDGVDVRVHEFIRAFPVRKRLGNKKAGDENVIEELHIEYEYYEERVLI